MKGIAGGHQIKPSAQLEQAEDFDKFGVSLQTQIPSSSQALFAGSSLHMHKLNSKTVPTLFPQSVPVSLNLQLGDSNNNSMRAVGAW